jgi:hypothetical protein
MATSRLLLPKCIAPRPLNWQRNRMPQERLRSGIQAGDQENSPRALESGNIGSLANGASAAPMSFAQLLNRFDRRLGFAFLDLPIAERQNLEQGQRLLVSLV